MCSFDKSCRKLYEDEVRERWGDTESYAENRKKTDGYSENKWNGILGGLSSIFAEFAEYKNCGGSPDSDVTQKLVKKLQDYITANFYNCTDDILAGLGQMYICDERFKENIDKCGEGTAEFVSDAIKMYFGK